MSVLNESQIVGSSGQGSGYDITDSLRLRSSASAYLSRTPSSAGNRKTWTWSAWVKRGTSNDQVYFSAGTGDSNYLNVRFQPDYISVVSEDTSLTLELRTSALYRDHSAWYHIVVAMDTTQSTDSNRAKLYVNGEQITSFSSATYPSLNYDTLVNNTNEHSIGRSARTTDRKQFDGYLTEVNLIDGTALTASDFGETDNNGTWIPKKYLGSYGTNGFYLPMKPTTQATGFNTVTYTGNGGTQSITGVGFSPDLVWVKNRDETDRFPLLTDTIRGATKSLASSLTSAESGTTYSNGLTAFGTNGFSVGNLIDFNGSADKMVAWCWDTETTTAKTYTVKVVSDGGNKYRFDDFGSSAVTLDLHESGTYTFDQSDSSNSGHPLRFSTTSDGTHGGGSAYTTGVTITGTPGTAGAKTVIVVAASAPTLYYYCSVHSGMGGQANTNATKGSSNFDGTLKSTVSANPSTGFSIATWSGDGVVNTVGHGLGVAPKLVIVKNRGAAVNWNVWATGFSGNEYLLLNSSAAKASYTNNWGSTPTTDVFGVGNNGGTNGSGGMVAYSFADVTGYQKIGSYTGNGSTTGPTVTTGFRPAWLLIKNVNDTHGWQIYDATRNVNNPRNNMLSPNVSSAEYSNSSDYKVDFNDNGFQIVTADAWLNANSQTMIYLAIADTRDAKFNFDASGNKNNWTPNNINSNASGESSYDLMSDVPTLTDEDTANFATLNPLGTNNNSTITDGNLTVVSGSGASTTGMTIGMTTGKWYAEYVCTAKSSVNMHVALVEASTFDGDNQADEGTNNGYMYQNDGNIHHGGASESYGASWAVGDVIGIAFDASTRNVEFFKNGAGQGTYTRIASENSAGTTWIMTCGEGQGSSTATFAANFGQRPFAYTPPTGYKKINTFNLPDSTITDGSEHFANKLYTGNASTQSITGLDFSPDLTWIKVRNSASYEHMWFDSVRGVTKYIRSNTNAGEGTVASTLTSFDSNGFSLGNNNDVNGSGFPIIAWNWKAGGATAANTDGSIATQISANTTAGFNIVSYSGNGSAATVGHGLGVIPDMIITKNRSTTNEWCTWHKDLPGAFDSNGAYIYLNTTDQAYTTSVFYDGTGISSTRVAFRAGTGEVNGSGNNYIMYAFKSVEGYSKFDKYTGNGSTDGSFIYTGFRPAFLLIKVTSTNDEWVIYDTARDTYNVANKRLNPNSAGAEQTSQLIDILSNGFKARSTGANINQNAATYIYMAFAENPFKNSNAR